MKKKQNFHINKKKIEMFCKKHHIIYFAIFGSVLTSNFQKDSDIDILVKFEKKHTPSLFGMVNLANQLQEEIFGASHFIDLKTPGDLSRYFRDEVLKHAKVIWTLKK